MKYLKYEEREEKVIKTNDKTPQKRPVSLSLEFQLINKMGNFLTADLYFPLPQHCQRMPE